VLCIPNSLAGCLSSQMFLTHGGTDSITPSKDPWASPEGSTSREKLARRVETQGIPAVARQFTPLLLMPSTEQGRSTETRHFRAVLCRCGLWKVPQGCSVAVPSWLTWKAPRCLPGFFKA